MLIEHSKDIGIVPDTYLERISIGGGDRSGEQKVKKRRSGSLSRALANGINVVKKKIIRRDSTDFLNDPRVLSELNEISVTPCIAKANKKRKVIEIVPASEMGFSAKKK